MIWSSQALTKLLEKPIASKISHKNGDDGKGKINFPIVTICPKHMSELLMGQTEFEKLCNFESGFETWSHVFKYCENE